MYKITIIEIIADDFEAGIPRLSMIVDHLDINAIIAAANRKPRKPRADKGRSKREESNQLLESAK